VFQEVAVVLDWHVLEQPGLEPVVDSVAGLGVEPLEGLAEAQELDLEVALEQLELERHLAEECR
jgi:hypothetical protein